jgi:hypothetical protein
MPDLADTGGLDVSSGVPDKPTAAPAKTPEKPFNLNDVLGVDKQLGSDLAGLSGDRARFSKQAERNISGRLEEDSRQLREQYNATAMLPSDFQKWDADAQSAKYRTDPLQAFGSLGSVFGMIASAFSRAPMENALNASAAAMGAIRAGDEEAYNRAHEAWKQNTDLAFKRNQIEQQRYKDAMSLFDTDMRVAQIKLTLGAQMFDDRKMALLAEHGMYPEIYKLLADRDHAVSQAMDLSTKIQTKTYQDQAFNAMKGDIEKIQDPVQRGQAYMAGYSNVYGFGNPKPNTPEAIALGSFLAENFRKGQFPSSEKVQEFTAKEAQAKATGRYGRSGEKLSPQQLEMYNGWLQRNLETMEFPEASDDAYRRAVAAGKPTAPSMQAESVKTFESILKDVEKEQPELTPGKQHEEATRRFQAANAKPTAATRGAGSPIVQAQSEIYQKGLAEFRAREGREPDATESKAILDASKRSPKLFSTLEEKALVDAPILMEHLQTLDALAEAATGPIKGVPERIAAKYGGINDPAIVWQTAHGRAEALVAELEGSGRMPVAGLKKAFEALPKDYQAARYNRAAAQLAISDLSKQSRSLLDVLEQEGKTVPESVKKNFNEQGIYPSSQSKADPLVQFRQRPTEVSDDVVKELGRYGAAIPRKDQEAVRHEMVRRMTVQFQQDPEKFSDRNLAVLRSLFSSLPPEIKQQVITELARRKLQ